MLLRGLLRRWSLKPAIEAVTDGLARILGVVMFEASPHHADARAVQVQGLPHADAARCRAMA